MQNIVLIGMPGVGKSTVGRKLAKRLGFAWLDTDALIVQKYGKSLPTLLAEQGVDGFLALEGQIGTELRCVDSVIATGGSMVFSDAAMQNLKNSGTVVWLDTSLMELERRIRKNADRGIAARPSETLADIDAVRRPLYQKYVDIHIRTNGNIEGVVNRIIEKLPPQRHED